MQDDSTPAPQPAPGEGGQDDRGQQLCSAECARYSDGHRMHPIRARHTGEQPWGWRDAVITSVDGARAVLRYLDPASGSDPDLDTDDDDAATEAAPRLWHHHDLAACIAPGDPVRLHERCRVLGTDRGWITVAIDGGLGPVPNPTEPDLWAAETTPGIVDVARGAALPTDRPRD